MIRNLPSTQFVSKFLQVLLIEGILLALLRVLSGFAY